MRFQISLVAALFVVSCGPAQNDPGPGGVTVSEAKALDEAAEILDERNAPSELKMAEPNHGEDTIEK